MFIINIKVYACPYKKLPKTRISMLSAHAEGAGAHHGPRLHAYKGNTCSATASTGATVCSSGVCTRVCTGL